MINCTSFDYINLLTKAADTSWKRETVISNNIANVNTPGYKRKDLNFQGVLTEELGRCKHESLDSKVSDVDLSRLDPQIYVDSANYSYRMDGNTVDIDTENVELASEQIRYEGLIDCINSEFERMKAVIS